MSLSPWLDLVSELCVSRPDAGPPLVCRRPVRAVSTCCRVRAAAGVEARLAAAGHHSSYSSPDPRCLAALVWQQPTCPRLCECQVPVAEALALAPAVPQVAPGASIVPWLHTSVDTPFKPGDR